MLAQYTEAHTLSVNSLVFSPHRPASASPLLCSTSSDATTAFWDTRLPATEACVLRLTGLHSGPVNHALFLPSDEYTLLTAADDASIICWDIRRPNALVTRLDDFHEGVNKMILLPPDSITDIDESVGTRHVIASACDDGLVYIHAIDLHTSSSSATTTSSSTCQTKLLDKFWVSTSTVNDLLVPPHAPHVLITASEDCALRSWRLKTHTNISTTTTSNAVLGGFGVARMSDEERLIASLDEFENPVNHVALVPAGLLPSETSHTRPAAAAATPSHTTNSGTSQLQREAVERQNDEDNNSDAATPSSATHTRRSSVHRNNEDEEANNNEEDNDDDEGNVWLLAACSEFVFGVDMRARRGRFGRGARSFVGHRDYVRGLEFTSAGTLLTVSDDGTAMEWDIASTEPIRQVRLHDSYVMASAVAPQKEMFASGSDDGVIRLWRLPFETERMTGERA